MAAETVPVGGGQTVAGPLGYDHLVNADDTRQAQHREANDAVADVQMNDIFSREQAGTMVIMGKNFEANSDRRNKIFDLLSEIHGGRLATEGK